MAIYGSDITSTSRFLQNHSGIMRFPTSQREWNSFIQELSKWFLEYEGTYDAAAQGFSTVVTFTGITYYRYGKLVMIRFPVQEESSGGGSATTFVLAAMPERIWPAKNQIVPITNLVDNGAPITGAGQAKIAVNGTITFGIDGADGGFTGSGNKGFGDVAAPVVIYTLFDALKSD